MLPVSKFETSNIKHVWYPFYMNAYYLIAHTHFVLKDVYDSIPLIEIVLSGIQYKTGSISLEVRSLLKLYVFGASTDKTH